MKVKDLYAEYKENTRILTESGRSLAFGAAATGWFFRSSEFTFPAPVVFAVFFVALFFLLDTAQFFISAITLRWLARSKEVEILQRGGNLDEEEVFKPETFTSVPFVIFVLKIACLLLAYLSLAVEFLHRLAGG